MAYVSMGEAQRRVTEYLNRFSDAISCQDGASLKRLLSLPSLPSLADALAVVHDPNRLIRNSDDFSQLADIIAPLFRALQSYRARNLVEAYQSYEKSVK